MLLYEFEGKFISCECQYGFGACDVASFQKGSTCNVMVLKFLCT